MISKLKNVDLKDKIYEDLKEKIINLYYEPGEVLSEDKLKEEYGVSRTPIREALIKLEDKGLVNIIPRGITCVSQIDINNFREVLEVKSYLLRIVIWLSIEKINKDIKYELKKLIDDKESYMNITDIASLLSLNEKYNEILVESCMNNELKEIIKNVNAKVLRFFNYFLSKVNQETIEELKLLMYDIHLKIYQCIEEKDLQKAKAALENHYQKTLSVIRKTII